MSGVRIRGGGEVQAMINGTPIVLFSVSYDARPAAAVVVPELPTDYYATLELKKHAHDRLMALVFRMPRTRYWARRMRWR